MFALLFGTLDAWGGRYIRFAVWSLFAALIHRLMAGFGISFGLILVLLKRLQPAEAEKRAVIDRAYRMAAFSIFPSVGFSTVASEAYRQAADTRSYFFVLRWEWYEWVGIFAPLVLFWWFSRMARAKPGAALRVVSQALIIYGCLYFLGALVLTIPARLLPLARLQPMRSLHLLYVFLILIGGGLLGAHVLKRHAWRWILLFAPLCGGMWFAQRQLFRGSPHIEWPGAAPSNDWLRAFEWVQRNTPADAVFALDPNYMLSDDQHGFRAIAERSRLADAVKDSGAITMFPEPPFAEHWLEQVSDQKGWEHFQSADLRRLQQKYGISWVVLQRPGIAGLTCPYTNSALLVCRLN